MSAYTEEELDDMEAGIFIEPKSGQECAIAAA